ncbi:MAG: hypothetical protein KDA45_03245 [Planctomycetales bacterium]|nr:hypothetical protein [Planctomycetales bacterium]
MKPQITQPAGPRVLTRTQLTAALILVTLLPFSLVVVMYTSLPTGDDPTLQAEVSVGPRTWPNTESLEARLVPSLVLRNPTAEEWNNVNLSINEQYHFFHPQPVPAGAEIFVPLKFFHTKGNQYYHPESQELRLVTIYAQIPSGARAIVEVEGAKLWDAP